MRRLPILVLFIASAASAADLTRVSPAPGVPVLRYLTCDLPASDASADLSIFIVGSTNIAQPKSEWAVITNYPSLSVLQGTNWLFPVIESGDHMFYASFSYSEYWGRGSFFSNVTNFVPRPYGEGVKFGIK
jgi:hypothetical protein